MDPPAIMNDGGFQSASFNLAEIWPFSINGAAVGGETGIGLDLRRFGHDFENMNVSANRDVSGSDPMVLDRRFNQNGAGGGARKRREDDDSVKATDNGVHDSDSKRLKTTGSRDENKESKPETEANSEKPAEQSAKPAEPPKQDYIHVRARRGQATDSHSLAERARREKISDRMKILQDLVPGCNKVIGKALVLDEIINYIQSLQRQVEFLSMKLEAVNSRITPIIEGFPSKDFGQPTFDASGMAYNSQAPREYGRGSSPEWLHMQIGGGFDRTP